MSLLQPIGLAVALGVGFATGHLADGGAALAGQPPKEDASAAERASGPLGEEHRRLEPLAGAWDITVKVWMDPAAPPMESTATVRREWALDGHFVIEHVESPAAAGMPGFRGMGIIGYNTVEKRYENVWIENMATHVSFMTGAYDAAKQTLTFEGDMLDPMSGRRSRQRHVIDLANADRHTAVGLGLGADGKETKNFEGVFTRRK